MTAFLGLIGGNLVPVDRIKRIVVARPTEAMRNKQQVFLEGGDEGYAYEHVVEGLLKRPVQLIPAEPGSKLIWTDIETDGPVVSPSPLIARALCVDGEVRPVTPAGIDDGMGNPRFGWFVQMPDGQFWHTGDGGTYPNEEALKDEIVKWAEARRPALEHATEAGEA